LDYLSELDLGRLEKNEDGVFIVLPSSIVNVLKAAKLENRELYEWIKLVILITYSELLPFWNISIVDDAKIKIEG